MMGKKKKESITDLVLSMSKKNRIVYSNLEGFTSVDLDKWLDSQPINGLLYDLNRLGEGALTFMEDDIKWVNDFAAGLVITRLHEQREKLQTENKSMREALVAMKKWLDGRKALVDCQPLGEMIEAALKENSP